MKKTLYPLHPAQREIYLDQLIDVRRPYYNVGGYIRLSGPLDIDRLKAVVRSVPEMFDVFNVQFELEDTEPVCYLNDHAARYELRELDLSGDPDGAATDRKSVV